MTPAFDAVERGRAVSERLSAERAAQAARQCEPAPAADRTGAGPRLVRPDEQVPPPPEPPLDDEHDDHDDDHDDHHDDHHDDDHDDVDDPEARAARVLEREIEHEVRQLRVREEAARRVRADHAAAAPPVVSLREFLAEPDPPTRWRLDGLIPAGARIMVAAAFKAGKTTLVGNLLRSLADGEPFLGTHNVVPNCRRVVLIDDELDEAMLRRWLREQGIRDVGAIGVVSLRGRVSSFNLLDAVVRGEWAARLAEQDAGVVVLDCLRPVLDALGLDEDKEAGRFLVAFDEMLAATGADEAVVVHHMGHHGERSRGSSRLRDWPDVEWRLLRQDTDDPASPRYLSAYGRDVDSPERRLDYDPASRRLTVAGGSRRDAAAEAVIPALLDLLAERDGLSGRQIEDALVDGVTVTRDPLRQAVKLAVRSGVVTTSTGPKRAVLHHHAAPQCASARQCAASARAHSCECASALIRARTHTQSAEPTSARADELPLAARRCEICGQDTDRPPDDTGAVRCERHAYRGGEHPDDEEETA